MSKKKQSNTSKKTISHVVAGKVSHATGIVSDEAIALRAYEIYEAEGRPDGRHLDHWVTAAAELQR